MVPNFSGILDFNFVGGIFNAQINTANDAMQALGRIRNHALLHVFCEKRQGNKPLSLDIIASKWLQTHQHDLNLMNLDNLGARVLMNEDYERLVLLVTQARNVSHNDFYQQLALLALNDGMKLAYYDNMLDTDTKKQIRDFKQACLEQDTSNIADQLPLTVIQLMELAKNPKKTMEDTKRFKKQQTIEFFNLSESDSESIKALSTLDQDGRFKKKILALELALGDEELAKKRFLEQTKDSPQFAADVTHFATQQELFKKLLNTLHLTSSLDGLSLEDYRYSKDDIIASGFLNWIDKNRGTLQGILVIPSLAQLQKDPIRFLSLLLAKLGLKQKRVGRSEDCTYHLNAERTNLLNTLITRRHSGIKGMGIPIDTSSVKVKEPVSMAFFVDCFQKIKRFFTLSDNDALAFA